MPNYFIDINDTLKEKTVFEDRIDAAVTTDTHCWNLLAIRTCYELATNLLLLHSLVMLTAGFALLVLIIGWDRISVMDKGMCSAKSLKLPYTATSE